MQPNAEYAAAWQGGTKDGAPVMPPEAPVPNDAYADAWSDGEDGVLEKAVKAAGVAPVPPAPLARKE